MNLSDALVAILIFLMQYKAIVNNELVSLGGEGCRWIVG